MTDQDQNGNLETPPDSNVQQPETPPDTLNPEGDQPTPETPAKSDSEDGKPEEKAEKTPEQIKDDAAYFQSEAQKAKEELAALQSKKQDEPVQPTVTVPGVAPPQPQPQPPLSKDDLNTFLQERPAEGFAALAEYMGEVMKESLGQYTKNTELQADNREANRILREFCSKNDISRDELQTATTYVKQLGVKGTAAGVSSMVIDRMILNRVLEHGQETVTAAAAKAAKAVKAQALTEQPGGAGISSPGLSELRKEMQKEADNLAPDDPSV